MMQVEDSSLLKKLLYFLALSLAVANSFDLRVIGDFRPTDIIFWAMACVFAMRVAGGARLLRPSLLSLGFLMCLMASTSYSWLFNPVEVDYLVSAGFIYKYLLVFLLYYIVRNAGFSDGQLNGILKALALSLFIVVAYTFYYVSLFSAHTGYYMSMRPDFPFSEGGGHVLGTYLATGFIVVYMYFEKRFSGIKFFIGSAVMLALLAAVFLTGSRAPVIAIAAALMYLYTSRVLIYRYFGSKGFLYPAISIALIMAGVYYIYQVGLVDMGIRQVERAFSMGFSADQSASSRLFKQAEMFDVFKGKSLYLLGLGPGVSNMLWYDGSFIRILLDSGILGMLFFMGTLLTLVVDVRRKAGRTDPRFAEYYIVPLVAFAVCNISSEHFLVNRSAIPAVLYASVIHCLLDNKSKEGNSPA